MADETAKENATKARIINHMNADHHDSLVRYAQHYLHVSPWTAHNTTMSGVDLQGLTLITSGKTHRVPFSPPLTSLGEVRERVVIMDREAVTALKRSDITVKEYLPPTGLWSFPAAAICFAFLAFASRKWYTPGSYTHAYLLRIVGDDFTRFLFLAQPYILAFMLFMHTSEMLYFMQYKLIKHNVSPRTQLFWDWTASAFIEGGFAFWRFNDHVRGLEEEKAKKKH
ncbi:hypothetical protein LTR78_005125 [Recurvomyces mirabilis]|uniref:DUF2470 domain-containing protein n=1 Tax=Recurvomyces mirabilis TaxID=574656 RepID=A0AAE0WP37_9PEZI|nr:hypothetical protein LTR78_005125 [Recurvomyces mirabilis]KAK5158261.1 hypothetical protein LTS14_003279 [Recurvomyces mirabilis]